MNKTLTLQFIQVIFAVLFVSDFASCDLRNALFRKFNRCEDLVVRSPFEGGNAEEAQAKADEEYHKCKRELIRLAGIYIERKAAHSGKDIGAWLQESNEVSFYRNHYVLTVDDSVSYGRMYVDLPEEYNEYHKSQKTDPINNSDSKLTAQTPPTEPVNTLPRPGDFAEIPATVNLPSPKNIDLLSKKLGFFGKVKSSFTMAVEG